MESGCMNRTTSMAISVLRYVVDKGQYFGLEFYKPFDFTTPTTFGLEKSLFFIL